METSVKDLPFDEYLEQVPPDVKSVLIERQANRLKMARTFEHRLKLGAPERSKFLDLAQEALRAMLRDLDKGRSDWHNSTELIAKRLGCEPDHDSILAHVGAHGHEPGYYLKLVPEPR